MGAHSRPRRSCLAVPGSSRKMLDNARILPVDQVFLDLEDAVAPLAKADARASVVAALREGGWGERIRAVRVNDATTPWAYRDVIEVAWLDLTLTQLERALGLAVGAIGIEAQIENAQGVVAVDAIAASSPRLETIIFGPADFMASIGVPSLQVGALRPDYPGDPFHHVLMRLLLAARAHDRQVIDGPYLQVQDVDGFRAAARRSAALGYDGKWVLHPVQIDAANEVYAPSQADYDRAEQILAAYEHATSDAGGRIGAVMLGDDMIDEASRTMALGIAAKGRAAGLHRSAPP